MNAFITIKCYQNVLFVLVTSFTLICPAKSARFVRSENRIVGGVNVTPYNKYPMMVYIAPREGGLFAGTIWNKYFVLTAANNAIWVKNGTRALAGIYNYNNPDPRYLQNVSVVRLISHETYSYGATDKGQSPNDIAILELETALVWNDYVTPTNVPSPDWDILPTTEMIAISVGWGWGQNRYGPINYLQEVSIPLLTTDQCQRDQNGTFIEDQLCTSRSVLAGFCYGDQGGPLFVYNEETEKHIQVGIASTFPNCCYENLTTCDGGFIFTKVSKYLRWIGEAVRDCSRPKKQ